MSSRRRPGLVSLNDDQAKDQPAQPQPEPPSPPQTTRRQRLRTIRIDNYFPVQRSDDGPNPATPPSLKRKQPDPFDVDESLELEMIAFAENSAKRQAVGANGTPQTLPLRFSRRLAPEAGPPTPSKSRPSDNLRDRHRLNPAEPQTPTPVRVRPRIPATDPSRPRIPAINSSPQSPQPRSANRDKAHSVDDLIADIMNVLEREPISRSARQSYRQSLDTLHARYNGVVAGRDISQSAVKKYKARVAELQERVADLENRLNMPKEKAKGRAGRAAVPPDA